MDAVTQAPDAQSTEADETTIGQFDSPAHIPTCQTKVHVAEKTDSRSVPGSPIEDFSFRQEQHAASLQRPLTRKDNNDTGQGSASSDARRSHESSSPSRKRARLQIDELSYATITGDTQTATFDVTSLLPLDRPAPQSSPAIPQQQADSPSAPTSTSSCSKGDSHLGLPASSQAPQPSASLASVDLTPIAAHDRDIITLGSSPELSPKSIFGRQVIKQEKTSPRKLLLTSQSRTSPYHAERILKPFAWRSGRNLEVKRKSKRIFAHDSWDSPDISPRAATQTSFDGNEHFDGQAGERPEVSHSFTAPVASQASPVRPVPRKAASAAPDPERSSGETRRPARRSARLRRPSRERPSTDDSSHAQPAEDTEIAVPAADRKCSAIEAISAESENSRPHEGDGIGQVRLHEKPSSVQQDLQEARQPTPETALDYQTCRQSVDQPKQMVRQYQEYRGQKGKRQARVFENFVFVLCLPDQLRKQMETRITLHGGKVWSDVSSLCDTAVSVSQSRATNSPRQEQHSFEGIFCVGQSPPARTPDFVRCLALMIPCVRHTWVERCTQSNSMRPWYLEGSLGSGYSTTRDCQVAGLQMCASLDPDWLAIRAACSGAALIFSGLVTACYCNSPDSAENKLARQLLFTLGCTYSRIVTADDEDAQLQGYDFVVLCDITEDALTPAQRQSSRLIKLDDLYECVIVGGPPHEVLRNLY
ncbi:uncharacterized protein L969DRAFT_93153 [Mixia osmundae IAM 14324]|uniref:BRCT domain-containing protein n=1 Tax=Mixia osmundae (strain CBS 9802 / IAM 14324 / JCM 22182 / KY 12970) TaxID=764103 RepID=G7E5Y0_MIXOS|nr:uncharacterized protein L969DRAFT_93153 [Mixia osmundae IAM 14324]KEI40609.1 hypothetical protein L969DRAFT_93153 [Mixia osmundae IAM 14324]GAA98240.1 hypothetical protein E5Q_04923 [Mixia osmundae IAM 14324]